MTEEVEATGFDAFELKLGDLMRGERATLGKSLLDVQRELKIKAPYIAAIENCDPTAFDTPGFIAGYVRSYGRYLGLDPDWAFDTFCQESGFVTAHGMSDQASSVRATREQRLSGANAAGRDIFASSTTPFIPIDDSFFSGFEPRAAGSVLVLMALIGGLGYGGWTLLQEVQKVQLAPVEQAPVIVAEIDPLAGASRAADPLASSGQTLANVVLPSTEALERLYRPQALDLPVLVSRDGPIAALRPDAAGTLSPITQPALAAVATPEMVASVAQEPDVIAEQIALAAAGGIAGAVAPPPVQVTVGEAPEVVVIAVREAWVRVRSAGGAVIFEGTLQPGDTYVLPATQEPATLRVGASGAIYFAVNGIHYGPAGPRGSITADLALSADNLTERYQVADLSGDADLAELVNVAEAQIDQ